MKNLRQHGRRRRKAVPKTGSPEPSQKNLDGETLLAAVRWVVSGRSFQRLSRHGNTKWITCDLIILAVLWVWSSHTTLTGAFGEAHGWSLRLLGHAAVGSYQGLSGALLTATATLLPLLQERMRKLMERHGGEYWRVGGWVPLAVDGSRVSTPRTALNEQAFCAPNYGRSACAKHRARKRRQRRVPGGRGNRNRSNRKSG